MALNSCSLEQGPVSGAGLANEGSILGTDSSLVGEGVRIKRVSN